MKYKKQSKAGTIVIALFAVLVFLPVVFMFVNSFMSPREAENRYTPRVTAYNYLHSDGTEHYMEPALLPDVITADGYQGVLIDDPLYVRLFWNSVLIALPILLGQLLVSPLAAYAFEMMRFKGKETLYFLYIMVMLMPLQLLMVPHYIAAEALGYNNTWWAIVLPGIFAPFGTFLIRQQLKGFDRSIFEAARLDGASEWRVFRHMALPGVTSAMAALAVLTFADCWNIVDQAVVFIKNSFDEPLSVYLSRLVAGNPGQIFAIACIYMFPAVIVFALGREQMAYGISLSAGEAAGL